ncbi:MAG: hypothetical protein ACYC7J_04915 [Syntrophales bacterium]
MIKIRTKMVKEELPEMIVNPEDVKIIAYLPTCPKCKRIDDISFFNITNKIYECSGCNLRFRLAGKAG